ncbi:DUF3558 family protein [Corynebacterium sp. CCUG 71335]|uniref:DUF3558 family protein n=2 Tax=Corynebacterium TaxID=1716 RepID=UPI00210947C9|nr:MULTISPECIES: DUF3558 family protein [unclassified Corynebacterium]MCQ4620422.1 DUF3558 family protein [Corynebacterium sp. CCUG 71335]MCQ4622218.1 DUF3558 family protein [Corynebacterium sp. CCUG 70398]MCQ4625259.1 DUF3558 family protein [Corynebacterium sp. CCUG 69979]
MRDRGFSIVIGVMLALTLAGCGLEVQNLGIPAQGDNQTEGGLPATGEPEVERPAFHFRSGTLELGDFVYEDIKDNLFDPCQEISAEEFAKIGFKSTGQTQNLRDVEGLSCPMTSSDSMNGYALGTIPVSLKELEASGVDSAVGVSDVVPGLFTYRGRERAGLSCVAAVDTERGQLGAIVGVGLEETDYDALCAKAVDIMESLYKIV